MTRIALTLAALLASTNAFAGLSTSPIVGYTTGLDAPNLHVTFVLYNASGVAVESEVAQFVTPPNALGRFETDGFDHVAGNNPDNIICLEVDSADSIETVKQKIQVFDTSAPSGPWLTVMPQTWSQSCRRIGDM